LSDEPPKEIDEALRIARETRQSILDGNNKVQSSLRGFLTVAQILSRTDDLVWAKNELTGYENFSDLPEYRLDCYG